MPIELTRIDATPGARLVAVAEELSGELAARAARARPRRQLPLRGDRRAQGRRLLRGACPRRARRARRRSAHDLVVASSRLARGDASVAIGVNMHLVAVLNMERRRQVALAAGAERRARGFAASLEQIARDGVVLAAAISERGQDLTRPGTRPPAPRRAGGSTAASSSAPCPPPPPTSTWPSPTPTTRAAERYAYAMVPTDAPGVVVHDDWDGLGMRASGSNSISLEGVELPESGVRGGFRAGDPLPYIERNLVAGLFHAAASLGIAESADAIARRGLAGRINGDARPRMQVADNAVDLAAARGVLRARPR